MISEKSPASIEKSLRLSLVDGFLCSLMVGAGESYLPAYVLSVGMSQVFAGILASLPVVSGAFLQLLTPKLLQKIPSHKNWVVASALLQATAFLPLIYFSLTSAPGFWTLFLILTLYWGAGFSSGSAWNFWMGHLVSTSRSSQYFAFRTRLCQMGVLMGIVGGGLALHKNIEIGPFTSVFSILFVAAFCFRLVSSWALSRKLYLREWASEDVLRPLRESWNLFFADSQKKKFFGHLIPFQVAVYMSSSFVAPYMLAQLKLNYGRYMGAIAVLFLGKITALYIVEKLRVQLSGRKILLTGALMMIPCPILWAVVGETYHSILALQILSGISLACFEVGLTLVFFQDLSHQEKVPVLTVYNLLSSLAVIVGTLFGSEILSVFGEVKSSYWILYGTATLLRGLLFWPLARHVLRWSSAEEREAVVLPKAS